MDLITFENYILNAIGNKDLDRLVLQVHNLRKRTVLNVEATFRNSAPFGKTIQVHEAVLSRLPERWILTSDKRYILFSSRNMLKVCKCFMTEEFALSRSTSPLQAKVTFLYLLP